MPKLSVLMSAYHAEGTVQAAVRSALRAMSRDAELVVALDGPGQDATATAIESVMDSRVVIQPSPVNLGVGGQAVRLFEATDSEYVARLDADDIAFPWRFSVALPRLNKVDYVFSTGVRFGHLPAPRPSYPLPFNALEVPPILLFGTPLFHSSMTARRAAIVEAGGYKPLRFGEDSELWVRAASLGQRLEKLATPCVAYRISPGQVSQNHAGDTKFLASDDFAPSYQALADSLKVRTEKQANGVLRPLISDASATELGRRCRPMQRRYLRRHMRLAEEMLSL